MRRRLAMFSSAIALMVVFALPATALAGHGIFYRIISATCNPGEAEFALNFVAKGSTDVNHLKVKSWVEQMPTSGGTWTRVYVWPTIDDYYTPDGTRHRVQVNRCYPDDASVYTKIVMKLQAFDADGIVWGGKVHAGKV